MQTQNAKIQTSRLIGSQVAAYKLPIVQQGDNSVISARELHRLLNIKTKFADWIKARIDNSFFRLNEDYFSEKSEKLGAGRKAIEYLLTMDMAKHLAMMENNEIGYEIRCKFIQYEKHTRGIIQLPKEKNVFRGLKRKQFHGRTMLPYADVCERCGYKRNQYHRVSYWMHFVRKGYFLYCTEEFAWHLYHQRRVYNSRKALKAMQPVLPFGDLAQLKGGVL